MSRRSFIGLAACVAVACFAAWAVTASAGRRSAKPPGAPGWDSAAITAEFDSADIEGPGDQIELYYTIDNRTERDFDFEGKTFLVAAKRRSQHDLVFKPGDMTVEPPPLLPAETRARLALHFPYTCPGLRAAATKNSVVRCIAGNYPGLAGFVLFVDAMHIRIDLPRPQ